MSPVQDRSQLPQAVAESVDRFVQSLDGLQVLVFLADHRGRAWAPEEVGAHLGIPPSRTTAELQRLCRLGLSAAESVDTGQRYRYSPAGAEELAAAQLILKAYETQRIALINYVASEALNRIRALANAFRVKKSDSHD